MTHVQSEKELLKYTNGVQPLIIETRQPWTSYHAKSPILGNIYEGHVALKIICGRNPQFIYIGNATGLTAPVFLQDFNKETTIKQNESTHNISVAVSYIMRRLQIQLIEKENPEIMSIYKEKMVQRIMKYIANKYNVLDYWVNMEIERCKLLLNSPLWDFEHLKQIYEMLESPNTVEQNMIDGYNKLDEIIVPDLELFTWVYDILIQF